MMTNGKGWTRTWCVVDECALQVNLGVVRLEQPEMMVMAILKADAYGHGLVELGKFLDRLPLKERPELLGVASVVEARKLHEAGVQSRIYLLGAMAPQEREEVVEKRWTPCVSSVEEAEALNRINTGKPVLPVHIAVDTGMGRGGFLPDTLSSDFPKLEKLSNLRIEGIGSHLPSADEDAAFTQKQIEEFDDLLETLNPERFRYRHISNSAGILGFKSKYCNLCRPGLMLYGVSPFAEKQEKLTPVMSLHSRISIIRDLPSGHGISYGRETILEKPTRVATVGIGYGDGYPRSVSMQEIEVLVRGVRCPLLGRVTMDQIMIDVSDVVECQAGDEVELFGRQILVTEIASKSGLIPWEILTGITTRVARDYR